MKTIFFHLSLLLLFLDPGSGMAKNQDPGSGIRYKHPRSATLKVQILCNMARIALYGIFYVLSYVHEVCICMGSMKGMWGGGV